MLLRTRRQHLNYLDCRLAPRTFTIVSSISASGPRKRQTEPRAVKCVQIHWCQTHVTVIVTQAALHTLTPEDVGYIIMYHSLRGLDQYAMVESLA